MTWKDRLQDASFRGVPFKVEEESAGTGRRVETHEYPNRDKPYTEDLGKVTFRPSITAYVVGDDCFDQRDRLIDALNKPGPGTLVHPTYGELKVCVDGEVRVSTSKREGRIVRFDLKFVEAGELSYPTSGAATAQTLMSSCSALDDCISDSFSGFSIDGVADFVQNDVVGNASTMLGYVSDAMKVVDSAVSDAARLLQGDISVLLPPPSSGKNFVEQVQKMWRTGKRLYGSKRFPVSASAAICNRAASGKRTVKLPPRRRSSVTWLPAPFVRPQSAKRRMPSHDCLRPQLPR